MQWFRLTAENQSNVTTFQKALSFLAELREYYHIYKVKNFAGYAHNFCSKGVKKIYHIFT